MAFDESYFREELDYLRQMSKLLAKDKPHLARFLAEKEADPDIERLLEGFALLSGSLRQKIEDEFPELTHSIINLLLPNYLRPVPSMTIIEYIPDLNTLTTEVLIPRNELVQSEPDKYYSGNSVFNDGDNDYNNLPACKFTLCRDVWLLPVDIRKVENNSSHKYGVIDVTFSTSAGTDLSQLDLNKLRFWLGNDDDYTRYQLYLWLNEYLLDAELIIGDQHIVLSDFAPTPVGFGKHDTLLPWSKNSHSGYRILLEYFCYPESFFFFDVKGMPSLPTGIFTNSFMLRLRFSRPLPADVKLRQESLRLFCTPAINLFSHDAEPILLKETKKKYPIRTSHKASAFYDIFSVNKVTSRCRDLKWTTGQTSFHQQLNKRPEMTGKRHWLRFEGYNHQVEYSKQRDAVYYHHRTKTALLGPGLEHFLSFVHADGNYADNTGLENDVVTVSLTCTNRDLPAYLRVGDINTAPGTNAAIASLRNVTRPTEPLYPVTNGELHWALISSVNLNYFSLLDKDALVQVLKTYDRRGIGSPQKARLSELKLSAIERLETQPVDRLFEGVPVRGLTSTLWIDPHPFVCEGEIYLLGEVLSHFFSLYASVNAFHELVVVNTESQEAWEWQEKVGQHPLI